MGCCESKSNGTDNETVKETEENVELNEDTNTTAHIVQTSIELHDDQNTENQKQNNEYSPVKNEADKDDKINNETNDNINDEKHENDHMNVSNNKSVKQMITVLTHYQEWKNNQNINKTYGIIEYLQSKLTTKDYDITTLMDDYQDIITLPDHNDQFEDIYILISKHISCNHSNCQSLSRNNRNRENCKNNKERINLYFGYNDSVEILFQQTLDKIHCYFLHSFDRSFRLKRNELSQIQQQVEENKDFDDDKDDQNNTDHEKDTNNTKTLFAIRQLIERKNKNTDTKLALNKGKFVTAQKSTPITMIDIDDEKDNKEQTISTTDKNDEKKDDVDAKMVYSFGYRYFYWDYYKHNIHRGNYKEPTNPTSDSVLNARFQDWYIEKKHNSLKEELLNNIICNISAEQWENTFKRAEYLCKTKWCKKSVVANWNPNWEIDFAIRFEESGIKNGDTCQVEHICALLLYTNYDFLQCKFSETYRKLTDTEDDESLKERHSNFANWGRYLREVVEVFGIRINGTYYDESTAHWKPYDNIGITNVYDTFYHGINTEMLFVATIGRLCGPTSTTIAINIAINFTKSTGLCLTLKRYSFDSGLRYFDCSWLSDYCNEQEMLFVGGSQPIKFHTIINTKLLVDYKKYLRALNQLNFFLSGMVERVKTNKDGFSRMTQKKDAVIVYKLITDESIFNTKINIGKTAYAQLNDEKLKKEIPQYIKRLFKSYCDNIDGVIIDMNYTFSHHKRFSTIFTKGFVTNQYGPNNKRILNVELELICQLFKNIKFIEIKNSSNHAQNNRMFSKNPNEIGSHITGDNRMVIKEEWVADLKGFFKSKIVRENYNIRLKKIKYDGRVLNQNGDITVDMICRQRKHEFSYGGWQLMQNWAPGKSLEFRKSQK